MIEYPGVNPGGSDLDDCEAEDDIQHRKDGKHSTWAYAEMMPPARWQVITESWPQGPKLGERSQD